MEKDFQKGEIVIYTSEDGSVSLDTKLENETIWLTQKQMAERGLFSANQEIEAKFTGQTLIDSRIKELRDTNSTRI